MTDTKTSASTPNCPQSVCEQNNMKIAEICKMNAWPPGHPILIVEQGGNVCMCFCR